MKIITTENYADLSKAAAGVIAALLKKKPDAAFGLATGSTPVGTYQILIEMVRAKELSFARAKTYNLDEYCHLPQDHPQSYYTFMHRQLFDHIDILAENIHIPLGDTVDLEKSCADYNNLLAGADIDLQLLGIGGNGHIGFNEPHTPFTKTTFVVELTEKTRADNRRFFNSIDEVPKLAITMGISNITAARRILLLASGAAKAAAIRELVKGEVTEAFPASVLKNHPDVTVIIDREAAALL